MNVSDNGTGPPRPYNEVYWITCEAILGVVTLIDLYLLKSVIAYLAKMRKNKKNSQLKRLLWIDLTAIVLALGRFASDQVVAFLGWQTDDWCFYSVACSVVLFSASATTVYAFLWVRQHAFYSNKQLKAINSKKLSIFGYVCLVMLVIGAITLTVFYLLPSITGWDYSATNDGCRDANDLQDFEILPFVLNLVGGFGQLSLLFLLLYPLIKCKKQKKGSTSSSKQQKVLKQKKNLHSNTAIMQNDVFSDDFRSANSTPIHMFSNENHLEFDSDADMSRPSTPNMFASPRPVAHYNPHIQRLRGHKKTDSVGSTKSIISQTKKSRAEKNRYKKLKKLIEKVFFLALICVASDILATILELLLIAPDLVNLVFYDVSLIINIICITVSFEKWKLILHPWKSSCDDSPRSRSSSYGSSMSMHTLTTRTGTMERFFSRKKKNRNISVSSVSSSRAATPDILTTTKNPPINDAMASTSFSIR